MPLPEPSVIRDEDEFIFTWPTATDYPDSLGSLSLAIDRVADRSGATYGEVHAELCSPTRQGRLFGHRRIDLVGVETVGKLAKLLAEKGGDVFDKDLCTAIMQQVIDRVLQSWRQGVPVTWLDTVDTVGAVDYAINPFIPQDDNAVIFGKGDSKKGWLAVAMMLHWAAGRDLPGGVVVDNRGKPRALYVDYEASEKETARRFQWMARGMGFDPGILRLIGYKRMYNPISEGIGELRRIIKRDGVGLVAIDSMGPAAGGKLNSDESAIPANNAIRNLSPANRVIIAHISKAERTGDNKQASIIGSVFFDNLARSSWKIDTEEISKTHFLVGAFHSKVNTGSNRGNFAFNLRFDDIDCSASISNGDISEHSGILGSLGGTVRERMMVALKDGYKTRKELSELLDVSLSDIRYAMARERSKKSPGFQEWSDKRIGLLAQTFDDDNPF